MLKSKIRVTKNFVTLTSILLFSLLISLAAISTNENLYVDLDLLNLEHFDIDSFKPDLDIQNETIIIELVYNNHENYDSDNDGIEKIDGVIDFRTDTKLNWQANEDKICTRWEIFSMDTNDQNTVCYGNQKCCEFIELNPTRQNYKEPLFLTFGQHGSTENNIVSSQVLFVDYNLGQENPKSEIHYSKWKSLQAKFRKVDNVSNYISKIKNNNEEIDKIKVISKTENNDKKYSIEINVSKKSLLVDENKKDQSNNQNNKPDNLVVSINNFDLLQAEWEKSEQIQIETDNLELQENLKEEGIESQKIITVKGVKEFLDEEFYQGKVELEATNFNTVLYCPDDNIESCTELKECQSNLEFCYIKSNENQLVTVYIPHFSTIIFGNENLTVNLTINNPDNQSQINFAENIFLDFTVNQTLYSSYKLNNQTPVDLGFGNIFLASLVGDLEYGVFSNGKHSILINVNNNLSLNKTLNHTFEINDITSPELTTNLTNNSIYEGELPVIPINVSSNEFSKIKYISNNNPEQAVSLGSTKNTVINPTLTQGSNTLQLNLSDYNENYQIKNFEFEFNLVNQPTCSDGIQNGDETGLDCGGSCDTCVEFTIETNQPKYNLTDGVFLNVVSRANSTVNISVKKDNNEVYSHTFIPVFPGFPIAETRLIENLEEEGIYTVYATSNYLTTEEHKSISFEMESAENSPISLSININDTTIYQNGDISFSSSVSNTQGDVTYFWDLNNDSTIDSTSASGTFNYDQHGTFIVNLTVFDDFYRKTALQTIKVERIYPITITVKNNITELAVQGADVQLGSIDSNTSEAGKTIFKEPEGEYRIVVKKPGYKTFSNTSRVNSTTLFEVRLAEADIKPPVITLQSPSNNSEITSDKVLVRYTPNDNSPVDCRFYTKQSSLWKLERTVINVPKNTESTFNLSNLQNGTYEWRIQCEDSSGNSNFSETRLFVVNISAQTEEDEVLPEEISSTESGNLQYEDTDEILELIDQAIQRLSSLNTQEREAANSMNLKKTLDRAKTGVERANRDLNALKWRRLNDTDEDVERQKIYDRIESIRNGTPGRISIVDKGEFVAYPSKEDVTDMLNIILNDTNLKFSKKEKRALIDANHKSQSALTITTKITVIDLEYLDGKTGTITLIQKDLQKEKDLDGLSFYEVIPKEIAEDASEIEFNFEYEIIKKDPVIKVILDEIEKSTEISYYIPKSIKAKDAENLKSILLIDDLKSNSKGGGGITGFVSLDGFYENIVETTNTRLIVEILAIIILLGVYIYYSHGVDKFMNFFEPKDVKEIKQLIQLATEYIDHSDYENASAKYREINSKFNTMDKKGKDEVKPEVVDTVHKVNLLFIKKLHNEAHQKMTSDRKLAFFNYEKMQSLYKIIPKKYKKEVAKRCLELHQSLNKNS